MTTLNISLSDAAQRFVEKQASKLGLASTEFLERLISDAMVREEQEELEQKLVEGLNSGPGIEATEAYWERKQSELIGRVQQGRGGNRA